ncbi:MAG: ABC transporter permease [Mediterranea sp.]|jgi:cell division protein FtsX|nr:ABC transporter permease [Mediterranea sp.]
MVAHYIKLAFRNLWKYRTQSLISIVGLAVGFVCFALANLWIHYEVTYDANRPGIDRTYLLIHNLADGEVGGKDRSSYKMSVALRDEFPEVETACATDVKWSRLITADGTSVDTYGIDTDSAFIAVYGSVKLQAGSWDFLHMPDKIALTEETAMSLFGTTDVLGQTVTDYMGKLTVCALLNTQSHHSNFYFGYWRSPVPYLRDNWYNSTHVISVRLRPDADVEAITRKIQTYSVPDLESKHFARCSLMPLAEYHYSDAKNSVVVQFHYLILFSTVGTLIILCALLNYLSLFVVRMRSRMREVELRRVCGSSLSSLFVLFATEYLFVLLIAGLLGMALMEWTLPEFRRLSSVGGDIYVESLLYFAGVLLFSFLFLLPFVRMRRHRYGRSSSGHRKHLFGRVSIVLQLIISMGFIFCVGVLMKQLHYVKTTDTGWERHNTGVMFIMLMSADEMSALDEYVKTTPLIREYVSDSWSLFPTFVYSEGSVLDWESKENHTDYDTKIAVSSMAGSADMQRFYGLKMIEGSWVDDDDPTKVVVNQTLVKKMGMTSPVVGKWISLDGRESRPIAGVVKDFHIEAPTVPITPTVIEHPGEVDVMSFPNRYHYLFKFEPGTWSHLVADVDSILSSLGAQRQRHLLTNVEERYNESLRAEELLMNLLGIAALVCILTAAFGIFSLVSLSCQQRRKEIAIRKVNGARIGNILALFVREYLLFLVLSAVVALPIGYVLMKRWLQNYVEQTPISWWLYALIFGGTTTVVALCIGWRVWQTARSNPAETIKAE